MRSDKNIFECMRKRAITEGIIYQFSYGWQKDVMTILRENVSTESMRHDLVGESLMILQISSSLADSKALETGGVKVDVSLVEQEV